MSKSNFIFYEAWWDIIKQLDASTRGEVLNAVVMYGVEGTLPELTPVANMAMQFIKKDIDATKRSYEEKCEKRRDAANVRWGKQTNANDANAYDAMQTNANDANGVFAMHNNKNINKNNNKENNKEKTNSIELVKKKETKKTPQGELKNEEYTEIVTQEGTSDEQTALITLEGEKEKSSAKKERLLNRQKVFYQDLIPFVEEYGKDLVREFYDYWTEPNKSQTQLKFELERTWDTKRRLDTWARRDKRFASRASPQQQPVSRLRENMAQMDRVAQILKKTN